MLKIKKDGTPKKSGGKRQNSGREKMNRTRIYFSIDNDLLLFDNLNLDEKNSVIRKGLNI